MIIFVYLFKNSSGYVNYLTIIHLAVFYNQ